MTMEISWIDMGETYGPRQTTYKKVTVNGETWQDALQKAVYKIEALSSWRNVTNIRPRVVDF